MAKRIKKSHTSYAKTCWSHDLHNADKTSLDSPLVQKISTGGKWIGERLFNSFLEYRLQQSFWPTCLNLIQQIDWDEIGIYLHWTTTAPMCAEIGIAILEVVSPLAMMSIASICSHFTSLFSPPRWLKTLSTRALSSQSHCQEQQRSHGHSLRKTRKRLRHRAS